jgi:hypothetical protein
MEITEITNKTHLTTTVRIVTKETMSKDTDKLEKMSSRQKKNKIHVLLIHIVLRIAENIKYCFS